MARFVEPEAEHIGLWRDWVASRPPIVRAIAEKLEPWKLYRLKGSGHRVTLYSINENGTVTVNVTGRFNAVMFERCVFGVDPNDLEECDLPSPGEIVGSLLTDEEAERNRDALREMAGIKPHQEDS